MNLAGTVAVLALDVVIARILRCRPAAVPHEGATSLANCMAALAELLGAPARLQILPSAGMLGQHPIALFPNMAFAAHGSPLIERVGADVAEEPGCAGRRIIEERSIDEDQLLTGAAGKE